MFGLRTRLETFGDEFIPIAPVSESAGAESSTAATTSSIFMSEAAAAAGGTVNPYHLQLILSINPELSDRSKKGLRWCYKNTKRLMLRSRPWTK